MINLFTNFKNKTFTKFFFIPLLLATLGVGTAELILSGDDYQGTESCKSCHSGKLGIFPGFDKFQNTAHQLLHHRPTDKNMYGNYSVEVDMGSAYKNAKVGFRIDGNNYYVILKPVTGEPVEYKIEFTYGVYWKQRYLVKIEDSYYMPPVQWNLVNYKDYSSGNWVAYNPQNWWNADGTLKPINNAFRTKSWDRNCAGCHATIGSINNTVMTKVTGTDTSWVFKIANGTDINMNVGCESCHGAPTAAMGKGHVNNLKNLPYDRKIEVCGQCHTRGTSPNGLHEYPYNENSQKYYKVGEKLADYYIHKLGVWADSETARQHHQQYDDFKLSKHYNEKYGITCVTCHDPHQSNGFRAQTKEDFKSLESGVGCVKCHSDKLAETNGINNHSKHKTSTSMCIACHNSKTATSGKGFDVAAHSFHVIAPSETIKYKDITTPAKGMPNSCALSCHRNGKGTYSSGPDFGIKDANLSDWTESTDVALADTLDKYYKIMFPGTSVSLKSSEAFASRITNNYPNPFSVSTKIDFEVKNNNAEVSLRIYNINGELINILLNDNYNRGTYSIDWNGRSVTGLYMPSGTYIAVLYVNNIKVSSRLLILQNNI